MTSPAAARRLRRALDRRLVDAIRAVLGLEPIYTLPPRARPSTYPFPFRRGVGLDGRVPTRGGEW